MKGSTPSLFRVVREAEEPFGLFFRVGKDDHTVVERILDDARVGLLGVVFDACYAESQRQLRADLVDRSLDTILDTGVMELATIAGHRSPRSGVSWATAQPETPAQFSRERCDRMVGKIADFVKKHGFSAVLAPTHYLVGGATDPWLRIDKSVVVMLRQRLDSNGCDKVRIYYPLATSTKELLTTAARTALKAALSGLPIDGLWLRIHPFGSGASDTMLARYIAACRDLHGLRIPLIAEKVGVVGLALLAFGAVSGVESGISAGERFDIARLNRPPPILPPDKPFRKTARVYLPDLCTFVSRKEAADFFQHRGLARFACRDTSCCRRGHQTMLEDPRRHFAYTRMGEIAVLSRITPTLRPTEYLERILRPATDNIGRVLGQDGLSKPLKRKFEISRRKQDRWRETLGRMSGAKIPSFSTPYQRLSRTNQETA